MASQIQTDTLTSRDLGTTRYAYKCNHTGSQPVSRSSWAQTIVTIERSIGPETDVQSRTCRDTQSYETTNLHVHTHNKTHRHTKKHDGPTEKPRCYVDTHTHVGSGLQVSTARFLRPCRACGRSTELGVKGPQASTSATSHLLGDPK